MKTPHYTCRKTYAALSQIACSARAILYSEWLRDEDRKVMYDMYENAERIAREFRWKHMENIDPESYRKLVDNGTYERYTSQRS